MTMLARTQPSMILARPGSLAGLMDLYEQNYIRLRQLIPDLNFSDEMISCAEGHIDLYLSIKERCKYTTMISLTYRFKQPGGILFQPDLHLTIYHDAKVAEVQHRVIRRGGIIRKNKNRQHKWKMNRFLYKWLGFCLYQGHHFPSILPAKSCQNTNQISVKSNSS